MKEYGREQIVEILHVDVLLKRIIIDSDENILFGDIFHSLYSYNLSKEELNSKVKMYYDIMASIFT